MKEKFETYPKDIQEKLIHLRHLILDVALNTEGVGEIEETLKWGEPSYLTSKTKSGTTIRIGWSSKKPNNYAFYVNCKTTLIDTYRSLFSKAFSYERSRALVFNLKGTLPEPELRQCIKMALRYHLDKNTL